MILRATVRDTHDDALVTPIDVASKKDFAKVERAAAAWARRAVRSMPLYGPARSVHVVLDLEWVADAAPVTNHQPRVTFDDKPLSRAAMKKEMRKLSRFVHRLHPKTKRRK